MKTQTKTAPLWLRVAAAIIDSAVVFLAWYWIIAMVGSEEPAHSFASAAIGEKSLTGIPAPARHSGILDSS